MSGGPLLPRPGPVPAITAIDEAAWAPIPYWLSAPEVSGADIAETPFTAFTGDRRHARPVRPVARRVRLTPGSQLALFTIWDYHAFVTDRDLPLADIEADHRRHAVVEQAIAELKSAGLKHLPPGRFTANAATLRDDLATWVSHARRTGGRAITLPRTRTATGRTVADREQTTAVRARARSNGYTVSDRAGSLRPRRTPSPPPTDPAARFWFGQRDCRRLVGRHPRPTGLRRALLT